MNKNVLVAIFGVLLAGSLGYNAVQYMQNSKSSKGSQDVAAVTVMRDSLQKELKLMTDSLNAIVNENSQFKEENGRLTGKIEELEKRPPTYISTGGGNNSGTGNPEKDAIIAQLRAKIADMQAQLDKAGTATAAVNDKVAKGGKPTKKDLEEIAKLRADLEASKKEIEDLKSQLTLVTQQRDAFEAQVKVEQEANADMKDRISRGALPQYGTLMSTGIAKKGDQQVETFKVKGVEKLKISFDVLDNPLIREPVEEEVTIRIIGPEGEVLCSNPALADKSKLFSLKQTIISDGEMHKVKWYYPQTGTIGKLKKGRYTTELWARGLLKQKNTFELN
jgi:predicted nuclease with TOPRIM domain